MSLEKLVANTESAAWVGGNKALATRNLIQFTHKHTNTKMKDPSTFNNREDKDESERNTVIQTRSYKNDRLQRTEAAPATRHLLNDSPSIFVFLFPHYSLRFCYNCFLCPTHRSHPTRHITIFFILWFLIILYLIWNICYLRIITLFIIRIFLYVSTNVLKKLLSVILFELFNRIFL